jgi:hypothetical protein
VNVVQSASPQQPKGKKKTKNKPKKNNNQMENEKTQTQPLDTKKQPQCKPKCPCLICGDDHYTQDFLIEMKLPKILKEILNPLS